MKSSRFKHLAPCFGLLVWFLLSTVAKAESVASLESASIGSNVLPGTTVKLVVERGVSASDSKIGDLFVARVQTAAYDDRGLNVVVPDGSWVTGRVLAVQTPALLSRAGKISLELEYLTSVTGEIYPLAAVLSFDKNKINRFGVLDPQTGFLSRALKPTQNLLSSEGGQIASIATLGIPVVFTLIEGSAKAAICKGDSVGLYPGEVFQIEIADEGVQLKQ